MPANSARLRRRLPGGWRMATIAMPMARSTAAKALVSTRAPSRIPVARHQKKCVDVEDSGGPWENHTHRDGRQHGLGIVNSLATDWGVDGDPLTGWVVWARQIGRAH